MLSCRVAELVKRDGGGGSLGPRQEVVALPGDGGSERMAMRGSGVNVRERAE